MPGVSDGLKRIERLRSQGGTPQLSGGPAPSARAARGVMPPPSRPACPCAGTPRAAFSRQAGRPRRPFALRRPVPAAAHARPVPPTSLRWRRRTCRACSSGHFRGTERSTPPRSRRTTARGAPGRRDARRRLAALLPGERCAKRLEQFAVDRIFLRVVSGAPVHAERKPRRNCRVAAECREGPTAEIHQRLPTLVAG